MVGSSRVKRKQQDLNMHFKIRDSERFYKSFNIGTEFFNLMKLAIQQSTFPLKKLAEL